MPDIAFDWFRNQGTGAAVLKRNVTWIWHFLAATGIATKPLAQCLALCDGAGDALAGDGVAYNPQGWARAYDLLGDMPRARDYFMASTDPELTIGFELSRAQMRLLEQEGRDYINLRTHPARFLPDTHFSAQTNNADIHARLAELGPAQGYLAGQASLHKARAARSEARPLDPARAAVFFAQTALDASRIHAGELVDDHFIAQGLRRYTEAQGVAELYYKDHPHEPMPAGLRKFVEALGAKPVEAGSYALLSTADLRVVSLSSSICYEAEIFGARPTRLMEASERFPSAEAAALGDNLILPANIYEREVWDFIIHGGALPERHYPRPEQAFAMASGASWSRA